MQGDETEERGGEVIKSNLASGFKHIRILVS
jgi:hypothetical protein